MTNLLLIFKALLVLLHFFLNLHHLFIVYYSFLLGLIYLFSLNYFQTFIANQSVIILIFDCIFIRQLRLNSFSVPLPFTLLVLCNTLRRSFHQILLNHPILIQHPFFLPLIVTRLLLFLSVTFLYFLLYPFSCTYALYISYNKHIPSIYCKVTSLFSTEKNPMVRWSPKFECQHRLIDLYLPTLDPTLTAISTYRSDT